MHVPETTPMDLVNARAMIDRTYNEAGSFQWAREVAVNAIEAGATKVNFGLDWNGVRATGVYRRFIADDGEGMDRDELVTFFRTLGGSSKAVGGAHENYGIGAKIALLPWNTAGLIIASWKDGEGNVIWAKADDETGEYGLRRVRLDDELTDVWPTGDDPDLGFDTELLKPEWLTDHGTVLLLLGDVIDQPTIRNDARRDQKGRSALREYMERRFWNVPDGVEIRVDELDSYDTPSKWPAEPGSGGVVSRSVSSASRSVSRRAQYSGVVEAPGANLHWYLAPVDSESEAGSRTRGFIAALYRDELYEHKTKHVHFRPFGVAHQNVREGLTIIAEPRLADEDRRNGAFPEADRNALLWNEGDGENRSLPWDDWARAFADNMPEPVRIALDANRRGGELEDESYKERLADMFGDRFKMQRLEIDLGGEDTVSPTGGPKPEGESKRRRRRTRKRRQRDGEPQVGSKEGAQNATKMKPSVALPRWEPCGPDDLETGMIAAYTARGPKGPTVQINVEHSVICEQIKHWTELYPHAPETVREIVEEIYGTCAIVAVAHSEQLKTLNVVRRTIDEVVRSEEALTLALLGLMPHDSLISRQLSGRLGKRRGVDSA